MPHESPWRSESRIFNFLGSWKFKPCSSKIFPFFFWNSWKRKQGWLEEHASSRKTQIPKQRNIYGRRYCGKQMGWLVSESLFSFKITCPDYASCRAVNDVQIACLQWICKRRSQAKSSHSDSSKFLIQTKYPPNARCISPRIFFNRPTVTHWCLLLLEVVHSAGPYPQVHSLLWEYTPMASVYKHIFKICVMHTSYCKYQYISTYELRTKFGTLRRDILK